MKKVLIESREFTARIREYFDDDTYAEFQEALMENPNLGAVIPGCGGLRKARVRDPGRQKGKRGGARVIYLHVPDLDWIFLLDVYGKDHQDDLTADEKKTLRRLAEEFKRAVIRDTERKG